MTKKSALPEEQKRIWDSFKPHPEDGSAFYKVVNNTMVLDNPRSDSEITFPSLRRLGNIPFLRYHPEDLSGIAKFQLPPVSRQFPKGRQWSVAIDDRQIRVSRKNDLVVRRVSCHGRGGWKGFVQDNDIRAGELLIFVMIGRSTYRVHRFPERVVNKPAFMVTVFHPWNCGLGFLETPEWTRMNHLRRLPPGSGISLTSFKPQEEEDSITTGRSWAYGKWKCLSQLKDLIAGDRLLFYETDEPSFFDVKLMDPIP